MYFSKKQEYLLVCMLWLIGAIVAAVCMWPVNAHAMTIKIKQREIFKQQKITGKTDSLINHGTIESDVSGHSAVLVDRDKAEVFNYGIIKTSENNKAHGIETHGNNNYIRNTGKIITSGNNSNPIEAWGDAINIVNEGSILTYGANSLGIYVKGSDATIQNSGEIVKYGAYYAAIFVAGNKANIVNEGSISTVSNQAAGIKTKGSSNHIQNTGEIATSGVASNAITVIGNATNIVNEGSLSTSDKSSSGIYVKGSGARIRNSGTIRTKHAEGIHVNNGQNTWILNEGKIFSFDTAIALRHADHSSVINNGEIRTTNINGDGIYYDGSGGVIDNRGAIFTAADAAQGIEVHGNGNRIINSDVIETRGQTCIRDANSTCGGSPYDEETSYGIWVTGNGSTIVNSGIIRTYGQDASGIKVQRAPSTMNRNDSHTNDETQTTQIVNTGAISASGKGSYGITVSNDHASVTNEGTIYGKEGGGSIHAEGHDTTVTLAPGSRTLGKVTFNHPEDAHVQINSQAMGSIEIEGMPAAKAISSDSPAAISGNKLTAIPAEALLSEAPAATNALTGTVISVIAARLDRIRRPLFSGASQDQHRNTARSLYVMPFTRRLRSDDFSHRFSGMIVGGDRSLNSGPAGLLGGFAIGHTNPHKGPRGKIGSIFAGLYRESADSEADLSLIGGYINAHEKAGLGSDGITSDYLYINPSVRVYNDFALGNGVLTPSASASYFGLWQLGNAGIGNTGLNLKHRSLQNFDIGGRFRYDWAADIRGAKVIHATVEAGIDGILPLRDSVKVEGNIKSAGFSSARKAIARADLRAGIGVDFRDDANLSAGVRLGYDNTRTFSQSAFLKLTWSF